MANEKKRVFASEKARLAGSNDKTSTCPSVDTTFTLTGKVCVEDGWTDREGKLRNTEKTYAYFEGTRNGKYREAGISAAVFLRRPFDGFTAEEEGKLSAFSKELINCGDAAELDAVLEKNGVYGGKTIKVESHILHNEVPFGKNEERPVRYANFVIE